jgi:hypothetical protein
MSFGGRPAEGLQRRPKQHALPPSTLHRDIFSYNAIPISTTMIAPTTPINREFEFIFVLDYRIFAECVAGATKPLTGLAQAMQEP